MYKNDKNVNQLSIHLRRAGKDFDSAYVLNNGAVSHSYLRNYKNKVQ